MNGYAAAAAAVHGAGYGHDMNIKMEADMLMDTGSHLSDMSPNGQLHGGAAMLHGDLSPNGQRARKNKEDKICGVCGDRALGYNFDAISCESCKAFFRRNAPKGLDYFKCPYDEKCKMDISNRRFCKRCRLKKCFEIGMRKEYILSEEEKALKRQKIEQNRMAKIDPPPATSTPPGAPPGATAGGSFAPTTT
jgi:nuclear receptor subfamily 1 group I